MKKTLAENLARSAASWMEASRILNIRVKAPYVAKAHSRIANCMAFLPDFGSSNGTFVGPTVAPDFDVDPELVFITKTLGRFCSFVNPVAHARFDADKFRDILRDWGYYGQVVHRPAWLDK